METTSGYIYLAFNDVEQTHKVGRTNNLQKRLSTLNSDANCKCWQMLHSFHVPDIQAWESYFVAIFKAHVYKRTPHAREYFKLPNEHIDFFRRFKGQLDFLPGDDAWFDYAFPYRYDSNYKLIEQSYEN